MDDVARQNTLRMRCWWLVSWMGGKSGRCFPFSIEFSGS